MLCGDLIEDNFAIDAPGIRRRLLLHCVELLDSPLLRRQLIPLLNAAADQDPVLRRKIQEKFNEALAVGGHRARRATNVMIFWNKNYKGGVATYIRTKINTRTSSVETSVHPFDREKNVGFRQVVAGPLRDIDLSPDASAIVNAFLQDKAAVFLRSKTTRKLFSFQETPMAPDVASSLVHSDESCSALDEACQKLPIEDSLAADWFIKQIAQTIGQEIVGSKPQLRLGDA